MEKNGKPNFFILLHGPTASGKTDFALELAAHLPVEIINADVGQMYVPLTIGTAKPDWQAMPVAHHFFDILAEPRNITVVEFRELCLQKMQQIWERNKIPLVVGGSSFYVYSLLFPPLALTKSKHKPKTEVVEGASALELWERLYQIDPERAKKVLPTDEYRIKRALEIWHETGVLPSSCAPVYSPLAEYYCMCVTRERAILFERIHKRLQMMLDRGWLQECRALQGTAWESFVKTKGFIGYQELFAYRDGESIDACIEKIEQRTRSYAKRQLCFWKKLYRDVRKAAGTGAFIQEIDLTLHEPHLYINQLRNWCEERMKRRTHE